MSHFTDAEVRELDRQVSEAMTRMAHVLFDYSPAVASIALPRLLAGVYKTMKVPESKALEMISEAYKIVPPSRR